MIIVILGSNGVQERMKGAYRRRGDGNYARFRFKKQSCVRLTDCLGRCGTTDLLSLLQPAFASSEEEGKKKRKTLGLFAEHLNLALIIVIDRGKEVLRREISAGGLTLPDFQRVLHRTPLVDVRRRRKRTRERVLMRNLDTSPPTAPGRRGSRKF